MRVELCNLYPRRPMHFERKVQQSCVEEEKKSKSKQCMDERRGGIRAEALLQVYSAKQSKADHLGGKRAAVCLTVLKQHHLLC